MKKQLLLSAIALAAIGQIASAEEPNPGDRTKVTYSTNLSLEWYGVPVGDAANASVGRTGIGSNGKFYIALLSKGVAVYGKDGQVKMIDNATTWTSINCDDAGHVYFRNDIGGWTGVDACDNNGAPAGWFVAKNGQFSVIDTENDIVVKPNVSMTNSVSKCRFDALPHIMGNMLTDNFEIAVPNNGSGNLVSEFIFSEGLQIEPIGYNIAIADMLKAFPSPANATQTLGIAQLYNDGDNMAVLANNHNDVTASSLGYGNNIAVLELNGDNYEFTGKWLNTPNHSSISGMMIFSYNNENYIVYPAGMAGDYPSGDGFFVMKEELLDSPKNLTATEDADDWSTQLHKAVAYKYATEGIATGNNYRGINVEPIEGQDGKFRIYFYDPGKSMQVWQLDLSGSTGIEDIVADKDAAKIFGGQGAVIVEGAENAQVYNLAGQLVAQGTGYIAVTSGVYVVKAGKTAAKVVVR